MTKICVVADTQDKPQEYIDKQMEGMKPSGLGYYKIVPVAVYK